MEFDINDMIERLVTIQTAFNNSNNATEKYALLQALNHIAEKELPIHGYWEDACREAMLRDKGAKV